MAQKGGSRKTIYVEDVNDPRLKAYNDSLDLYNSTALWEKALRQKGRKDISALSKIQGMNMGWGPYAFHKDVYKNIKPESVYTYNRKGQPWRVHKYKKPVQKVKITNKVKDKVEKKPKHKVVDEVPEVPVTTIPQLALRPINTAVIPASANEITPLNLGVPKVNQATTIEAEDVSTKMPIYETKPVYGYRPDGSAYIKEYKKVIVGYQDVGGKNYKRVPTNLRPYEKGGSLLTKKVTCKKCGWKWDAADGGSDITTCHKCGGKGLVHAKTGGITVGQEIDLTPEQEAHLRKLGYKLERIK